MRLAQQELLGRSSHCKEVFVETVVQSAHLVAPLFQTVFNIDPPEGTSFTPQQSISKHYKVWSALRWSSLVFHGCASYVRHLKDMDSAANDDVGFREDL